MLPAYITVCINWGQIKECGCSSHLPVKHHQPVEIHSSNRVLYWTEEQVSRLLDRSQVWPSFKSHSNWSGLGVAAREVISQFAPSLTTSPNLRSSVNIGSGRRTRQSGKSWFESSLNKGWEALRKVLCRQDPASSHSPPAFASCYLQTCSIPLFRRMVEP